MPGKQKAEINDMYTLIDNMSHEERASDMATATAAARQRNMTPDQWDAMEEATANQLVGVAAKQAEKDPTMMKIMRQSAKEVRALNAAETRRTAKAKEAMERRAAAEAASRRAAIVAMARAVRAADRTGPDKVVGELPAREKARLYSHPSGVKWEMLELESEDPGSSSRVAMGRKLYKTRNKKSRRGRQGKRTRRARISRRARIARRTRK
jgi:hypothetical protein